MTGVGSLAIHSDSHPDSIQQAVEELLGEKQGKGESGLNIKALSGDGSIRRFWRGIAAQGQSYIAIAPPEKGGEKERAEAIASWKIGIHLWQAKVAVPKIYGFDERRHLLVYEDLGDTHLQTLISELNLQNDSDCGVARDLYQKTIDQLIDMQCKGARDFRLEWCWDTPRYDRGLMLERESGYFLRAFWQGLLQQNVPDGLAWEFEQLADKAAAIPAEYFLHRDFQSRNVMVKDGAIRIIDYQGGRLGPLGYDLASLLIDPYVALPVWIQEELLVYYYEQLADSVQTSREEFREQYLLLAMQRNLQIIGAFSFLSNVRGKVFFKDFIMPAVQSLRWLLSEQKSASDFPRFTVLESVLRDASDLLAQKGL